MALNALSTLPASLCVKRSECPGKGCEVWSVKPIPISTRFGPYEGKLDNSSSRQLNAGFQWKVKVKESVLTLDGSEERESNWLRYVNYATNKEEQNLVAVQRRQSCVYYVACKDIPANTQLLVWYQKKSLEKRNNRSEGMPHEQSFVETTKNVIATKGTENTDRPVENACSSTQPFVETSIEALTRTSTQPIASSECLSSFYHSVYSLTQKINLITLIGLEDGTLFNANEQCEKIVSQLGNTIITTYQLHECGICHVRYATMSQLKDHIKRYHTGGSFQDANEQPTMQVAQQEKSLVITNRFYVCYLCHKRYARKKSAIEHMMDHTGEKPYECTICKKRFKSSSNLRTHSISHSTLRPFECEICQAKFKAAKQLKLHKLRHSGERAFECNVCNKRYFEKQYLTVHMTLHTGEKRFECQVCHKKFRKSRSLNIHRNIHTKEKIYECDVCNRQFLNRNNMRGHRRIHTGEKPYECRVCHRKFTFYSPFLTHMKIHAEKKSHQCEICRNTFTTRHTSNGCCTQRSFRCKVCNNEYTRYDDFLKHKLTHPQTSLLETHFAEASQSC